MKWPWKAVRPGLDRVADRNGESIAIAAKIVFENEESDLQYLALDLADADLIAHAPSDIDWLLQRIEHLERLVWRYQKANKARPKE